MGWLMSLSSDETISVSRFKDLVFFAGRSSSLLCAVTVV